jgi:hypothetical protein
LLLKVFEGLLKCASRIGLSHHEFLLQQIIGGFDVLGFNLVFEQLLIHHAYLVFQVCDLCVEVIDVLKILLELFQFGLNERELVGQLLVFLDLRSQVGLELLELACFARGRGPHHGQLFLHPVECPHVLLPLLELFCLKLVPHLLDRVILLTDEAVLLLDYRRDHEHVSLELLVGLGQLEDTLLELVLLDV